MSVEVYSSHDKNMKNCLVEISRSDFLLLEESICALKEKTGVYIDPYGDTKLYPDHGKILLSLMDSKKTNDNVRRLLNIIQESIDKDELLFFIGD
jgi:hypothetical protein